MPTITVDGQTLSIDGHRLWIISGTIAYHRVPAALWEARIADARNAGLNCIETPVVWSLHEPRPGVFDFSGDLDLPAFIRLIAGHKMHCILRVGPYIGEGLDLGGLPPWLLNAEPAPAGSTASPAPSPARLRSGTPEFLQPVSRYFAALAERVQPLQASLRRKVVGPIIAVQNEHRWLCGSQTQIEAYLHETNRYLRENGISVPIIAANDLFAAAEGEIEGWTGDQHLHANLRQLRTVRPQQPRIVISLPTAAPATWGSPPPDRPEPGMLLRRIAEVLAAGAQYNLSPFHAGTNFGFTAGRFDHSLHTFSCSNPVPDAPLAESGSRGPLYHAVRRISTFASQFSRIFVALDPAYQPAIVSLDTEQPARQRNTKSSDRKPPREDALVAVECRGSQGTIIFVFARASSSDAPADVSRRRGSILLADGSSLPVEMERDPVAWLLLDTHLVDRATLDYCNLNAFALLGQVFICYGPAGAPGVLSLNGSAFEVIVPSGAEPHISRHEGVTIVVCNEQTIDTVWIARQAVYIGASGLDPGGNPLPHSDHKRITRIDPAGQTTTIQPERRPAAKAAASAARNLTRGEWTVAPADEFIKGTSERYATIESPASLEKLGSPHGYGWLRLKFRNPQGTLRAGFFDAADRLHLYLDAEFHDLLGVGPGAREPITSLPLKQSGHIVTALIDNLGRRSEGNFMAEPKGLYGHAWHIAPLRAPRAKIETDKPFEPLAWRAPIFGLEDGDATSPRRITWKFEHRRRAPIFLALPPLPDLAALIVNGEPVRMLARGRDEYIHLTPEQLSRGINRIQLAVMGDPEAFLNAVKDAAIYEARDCITDKASWAFAKWEPPAASKFKPAGSGKGFAAFKGRPAWWRNTFTIDPPADGAPAPARYFDAEGLSKGQLFINGHNAGRYFVATRTGKPVPPQSRYYLPEPWLKPGGPNEITLFDEHGFSPERCRIITAETR